METRTIIQKGKGFCKELTDAVTSWGLLIGFLGTLAYFNQPRFAEKYKERGDLFIRLTQELESKVAGEDRVISTQEARTFLDSIGYTSPISSTDKISIIPDNIFFYEAVYLNEEYVRDINLEDLKKLTRGAK